MADRDVGDAGEDRYARLRRDLTRAVRAVCPRWLADRADDLVQVSILKVMAVERRGETTEPLASSYLYRVAYSAVIDEIRARGRRPEEDLDESEEEAVYTTSDPGPHDVTRGREIGRAIRTCLESMKEERRVAVTLHLLGHSVPDAAKLLGWPGKRTQNLVYRGLADLRACLEDKGLAP